MDNSDPFHSIKCCVGSGTFFGFKYYGTLLHHSISGGRIYMPNSKDDIIFINSWQLYRVSRYGTSVIVTYFDHDKEFRLAAIGKISSCDLVMYVFVDPMDINITFPIILY